MFWTKIVACAISFLTVIGIVGTINSVRITAAPLPAKPAVEKKAPEAELVVITNKNDGETVSVPLGSIVEVRLAGTRANTGWEGGRVKGDALVHLNEQKGRPGDQPSRPGLQPLPFGSEFLLDPNAADKAIGTYFFIYQTLKPGRVELHMDYITPGGPGVMARLRSARIAQFKVTIDVKEELTDEQMAELARASAAKGKLQELQEIRSSNQHLGGVWKLGQPLQKHRFWCVLHAYSPAAPIRSYLAVSRSGHVLAPFKSEDFAKLLQAENRAKWSDAEYLQAAALYLHLTGTPHQDGWKILNSPAEFMDIKFNMFPQNEPKRQQAARAIDKTSIVREKDAVRVHLWCWKLIGGGLQEWNIEFTPTDLKAVSREVGRFGGGGYD